MAELPDAGLPAADAGGGDLPDVGGDAGGGDEGYTADLAETLAESRGERSAEDEPEGYRETIEQAVNEQAEATAAATAKVDFDSELDTLCAPYADQLQAAGVDKHGAVRQLFAAEAALRRDPAGAMAWLAQSYAASLPPAMQAQVAQSVMAALGFTDTSQLGQAEAAELVGWRQFRQRLEQHIGEQQQQHAAVEQRVARQIQAFAQTRPDFDGLRPLMAALVQANEAQGPSRRLREGEADTRAGLHGFGL